MDSDLISAKGGSWLFKSERKLCCCSGAPSIAMVTPSAVFAIQPFCWWSLASRTINGRNPSPWTKPLTLIIKCSLLILKPYCYGNKGHFYLLLIEVAVGNTVPLRQFPGTCKSGQQEHYILPVVQSGHSLQSPGIIWCYRHSHLGRCNYQRHHGKFVLPPSSLSSGTRIFRHLQVIKN